MVLRCNMTKIHVWWLMLSVLFYATCKQAAEEK
jgi:hypothetical protein